MRGLCLVVAGVFVLVVSGCASTQELQQVKSEVTSLEGQLKEKQESEGSLMASQRQLEMALKKQLEANLELRQKLDESAKKADSLAKEIEARKAKIKMPSARDIQTALKNANFYKGEVDGTIGDETKEAIKKFQEANNLNPDGVVGSKTWEFLSKYIESSGENLK